MEYLHTEHIHPTFLLYQLHYQNYENQEAHSVKQGDGGACSEPTIAKHENFLIAKIFGNNFITLRPHVHIPRAQSERDREIEDHKTKEYRVRGHAESPDIQADHVSE